MKTFRVTAILLLLIVGAAHAAPIISITPNAFPGSFTMRWSNNTGGQDIGIKLATGSGSGGLFLGSYTDCGNGNTGSFGFNLGANSSVVAGYWTGSSWVNLAGGTWSGTVWQPTDGNGNPSGPPTGPHFVCSVDGGRDSVGTCHLTVTVTSWGPQGQSFELDFEEKDGNGADLGQPEQIGYSSDAGAAQPDGKTFIFNIALHAPNGDPEILVGDVYPGNGTAFNHSDPDATGFSINMPKYVPPPPSTQPATQPATQPVDHSNGGGTGGGGFVGGGTGPSNTDMAGNDTSTPYKQTSTGTTAASSQPSNYRPSGPGGNTGAPLTGDGGMTGGQVVANGPTSQASGSLSETGTNYGEYGTGGSWDRVRQKLVKWLPSVPDFPTTETLVWNIPIPWIDGSVKPMPVDFGSSWMGGLRVGVRSFIAAIIICAFIYRVICDIRSY